LNCEGTELTGDGHNFTCFAPSDVFAQDHPNQTVGETLPPGPVENTILCLASTPRELPGDPDRRSDRP
jgi:hypothetical protein